jgi:ABC transport system ATP-binding/permease protein
MMLLLRKLADKGHTIILVTHATNNINACDYICFLCQGGRLAYFGPPNEAKAYFGKTDFAEIYSALEPTEENPNIPAEAEAKFRQSPDYQRYLVDQIQQGPAGKAVNPLAETAVIKPPKRGNPWKQFWLLSLRYIELLLNDRVNLAILVLQAPIIALILYFMTSGGTFHATSIAGCQQRDAAGKVKIVSCQVIVDEQKNPFIAAQLRQQLNVSTDDQVLEALVVPGSGGDAQKTLFIMAFAAVMFGCINGSREIVKENAIYRRERTVNLGITPYIFSKFIVLGVLSLLQAFILIFFVNQAAPFGKLDGIIFKNNIFLEMYISMALTAIAGLMTGLLISAIVPNNDRAMSLVPLPLIPQVIFAGVIFNLDTTNLQVPAALFPARWAMAAMGSSIGLHGNKLGADNFSYIGTLFSTTVSNPNNLNAVQHLLLSWGFLLALIVGQGLLVAWFLKRKDVRG